MLEIEQYSDITGGFAGYSSEEMNLNLIREIEKDQLKQDLPEMGPGDLVRVIAKVVEGGNVRSQPYEGTIIAMKGRGISRTFTVPADRQSWNWRRAHVHAPFTPRREH